ncbi:hypothetical protein [Pseudomonas sp. NFX15]|uniref:hypothetical protein n=1 Tax=Pseudomonas sp. NFX15 TaxID=2816958 RepID=UPI003B8B7AC5
MTDISKETFEISGGSPPAATAEKPPAPVVEWPKLMGLYVNYVRIAGTCLDGASVEISTSPSSWEAVPAIGTNWSYLLINPDAGSYENIQVRQAVKGVLSDSHQVPAFIVLRTSLPQPVVTEPPEFSFVSLGGAVHFQGTCKEGAEVSLFDLDENLLVRANVTDTTWSCDLTLNQKEIIFIKVRQAIGEETSSVVGCWIGVGLQDNRPELSITTPPYEMDTYREGDYVYFEGTCTPGSGMKSYVGAYDEWGLIANSLSMVDGRWAGLVGPMKARDSSTTGYVKLGFIYFDGGNNIIRQSLSWRTYVGDANAPVPPVTTEPLSGSSCPPGSVKFEGSCEEGARVQLAFIPSDQQIDINVEGNKWYGTASLTTPGDYSFQVRQYRGDLQSRWSEVVKFSVT